MSDKKEKLERENIESEENMLNGDSADKVESDDSETDESIGTHLMRSYLIRMKNLKSYYLDQMQI